MRQRVKAGVHKLKTMQIFKEVKVVAAAVIVTAMVLPTSTSLVLRRENFMRIVLRQRLI